MISTRASRQVDQNYVNACLNQSEMEWRCKLVKQSGIHMNICNGFILKSESILVQYFRKLIGLIIAIFFDLNHKLEST
mgnify:CR=1 FL=1